MCSLVLLSSCTLHQQQAPLSAEDAAAQRLAASELNSALIIEEKRLIAEAKAEEERRAREEAERQAREEAEEKAREEAEAKAEAEEKAREEAEEQARKEAESKEESGKTDNVPQLLNSRPKPKTQAEEVITPTAEQQEAARALLASQSKPKTVKKPVENQTPTPAPEEPEEFRLPGSEISGGLRTRRFAPPEEAISRDDDDEPMPNSVELRGLRSPVMKGTLPMNIDGKIIKED